MKSVMTQLMEKGPMMGPARFGKRGIEAEEDCRLSVQR